MDYENIMNMLQGLYTKNPAQNYVASASANINNLTRKRSKDLLSRYSTTGMGTVAPTVWTKIIGTTPFTTEKLNHTYFTQVFIKAYGASNSIKNYEVTIEAF